MAVDLLLINLRKRLDQHGYNSFASTHEGLGIITEEYHEIIEAIHSDRHSDHGQGVISEAIDLAVGCLWLVATVLEKDLDARLAFRDVLHELLAAEAAAQQRLIP